MIKSEYLENGFTKPQSLNSKGDVIPFIETRLAEIWQTKELPNSVINLSNEDEVLNAVLTDGLLKSVKELIGDEVVIWSAVAWIKKPESINGELCWHQDTMYWRRDFDNGKSVFKDRNQMETVTAWIAIDEITIENGGIWVLPKSHLQKYELADMYSKAKEIESFYLSVCKTEMKSGEFILFHQDSFHFSPENNSKSRRAVITLRFSRRGLVDMDRVIPDHFLMNPYKEINIL